MAQNDNKKKWLEESLGDSVPSSMEHTPQIFAEEIRQISGEEYSIPCCYGRESLVFLPVNRDTSFAYWEITEALAEAKGALGRTLLGKVYDLSAGEAELCTFSVSDYVGNMYVHFRVDMHPVQVRIGYMDEQGSFVLLLSSNVFVTPGTEVVFSDEEVWMSVDGETREIIRASLGVEGHGEYSSRTLMEERMLEMARKRIYSSHILPKEDA